MRRIFIVFLTSLLWTPLLNFAVNDPAFSDLIAKHQEAVEAAQCLDVSKRALLSQWTEFYRQAIQSQRCPVAAFVSESFPTPSTLAEDEALRQVAMLAKEVLNLEHCLNAAQRIQYYDWQKEQANVPVTDRGCAHSEKTSLPQTRPPATTPKALEPVQTTPPPSLPPQDVTVNRLSDTQAQQILKSLIPPKKKSVVLNVFVLLNSFKNEQRGSFCSSYSSGSVKPVPGLEDTFDANLRGSVDCSDLYTHSRLFTFAIPDPQDPKNAAIVVFTAVFPKAPTKKQEAIATSTLGWGELFMHPQGRGKLNPKAAAPINTSYPCVLAEGKHGTYDVYLAESEKVGAKPEVTKFAVIELERVALPLRASKPPQ